MQTAEPPSTREATELDVKILDSTYSKADVGNISNIAMQLNSEEHKVLLGPLYEFESIFGGTLVKWYTASVELDLKPGSKTLNGRY